MANDRHSQTRKSGRNNAIASRTTQSVKSVTPQANSGGAAVANALLMTRPAEVKTPTIASPENVALRTMDSVGALVKKLCTDISTKSSHPSAPVAPKSSLNDENAWSQAVDARLNELIERSQSLERERIEIESLRSQLKEAIDTAENRLSSFNDSDANRIEELEKQLINTQDENHKSSTLLLHARAEYQELLAFIEAEAVEEGQTQAELKTIAQRVLEKTDARETELSLEVSQLHDQLQFLKTALDDANAHRRSSHPEEADLRIQIEQLRSQLLDARHEAVELRMQSNDLGSRLSKFQGTTNGQKSETLTWEQRKEALLQQLEAETHSEVPCDPRKVLEIERVLEQTTHEIDRRDKEISDLKALIEQQSIAHDGLAIGVAAVAEMIESDGMIVSERLRLKELREDWEQKQRLAEIEMSMERAKLARERLELQEKTRNFNDNNIPQSDEEKKAGKALNRGKWLARLGLRDE